MLDDLKRVSTRSTPGSWRALALASASLLAFAAQARAQDAGPAVPPPAAAPAAAPAPATPPFKTPSMNDFIKSIKYTAQAEGGISYNPQRPPDAYNFGQLFTDHANTVQLNQVLLTAERDTDPAATDWDFGFKLQGAYGSDMRYVHYLGEFTNTTDDRYQPEILEANVSLHVPLAFASGIDLKVGQFPTPEGYEVINAAGNPFYSHSYIFFYGLPFVATGALAVAHVNSTLDIYGEIDTGLNTTFGDGDNNREPAGLAGFALNGLMGGKLTVLALSHFGPENATRAIGDAANHSFRYLNDATVTYKPTTKLTLVTDGNYSRDDFFHAEAWGVAQYAGYTLSDQVTLNGRAEIFRDNNNFFVSNFHGNTDYAHFQLGGSDYSGIFASKPGTYSEFTVGLAISPKAPSPVSTLTFRPEVRYDHSLNNNRPYANGNASGGSDGQLTVAADMIVAF